LISWLGAKPDASDPPSLHPGEIDELEQLGAEPVLG
jgi:hypothetical protein